MSSLCEKEETTKEEEAEEATPERRELPYLHLPEPVYCPATPNPHPNPNPMIGATPPI